MNASRFSKQSPRLADVYFTLHKRCLYHMLARLFLLNHRPARSRRSKHVTALRSSRCRRSIRIRRPLVAQRQRDRGLEPALPFRIHIHAACCSRFRRARVVPLGDSSVSASGSRGAGGSFSRARYLLRHLPLHHGLDVVRVFHAICSGSRSASRLSRSLSLRAPGAVRVYQALDSRLHHHARRQF